MGMMCMSKSVEYKVTPTCLYEELLPGLTGLLVSTGAICLVFGVWRHREATGSVYSSFAAAKNDI